MRIFIVGELIRTHGFDFTFPGQVPTSASWMFRTPFALPFPHHMWSFLWLQCFHCSVNTVKSFPYLLQLVCVCTCPHLVVQLQLSPFQSMGHRWRRCSSDTNRLCSIYGLTTASLDMKSEHHLNKCVKPILQSSPENSELRHMKSEHHLNKCVKPMLQSSPDNSELRHDF